MPEMDEAVLKKVLPHSIEAEQSVIGSMLMDKEAITIASEQISGEDFYGKQYGILFDAMVELNDEAKSIKFIAFMTICLIGTKSPLLRFCIISNMLFSEVSKIDSNDSFCA